MAWGQQVRALTCKNFILTWRLRRSTACEVAAPLIIMLIIGILDIIVKNDPVNPRPPPFASFKSELPFPCRVFDSDEGIFGYGVPIPSAWCVPLAYAPANVADVDEIMTTVATRNGYNAPVVVNRAYDTVNEPGGIVPPECAGSGNDREKTSKCMLGFKDVPALKDWLRAHPGRTGVAVVFGDSTETENADGTTTIAETITTALPPHNTKYEVWTNQTTIFYKFYAAEGLDALGEYTDINAEQTSFRAKDSSMALLVQRSVDEAILAFRAHQAGLSTANPKLDVSLIAYPRLKDVRGIGESFSSFAVFISLIFSFMCVTPRSH